MPFSLFILWIPLIAIALLIPRLYLWLYIWFLLVLYAIFSFPSSYRHGDKSIAESFGEAILYFLVLGIIISIVIRLLSILVFFFLNRDKSNRPPTESSSSIDEITFIAYGNLSGYYIFLFLTSFLKGYQPAWEAYCILIAIIVFFFTLSWGSKKYLKYHKYKNLRSLNLFFLSLSLIVAFLAINSFLYTPIALKQTNKIIDKYSDRNLQYCIQPKLDTWLDLTPLTRWNKGSDWGATTNHAVLVIKTLNGTKLYNWSYKSRKWDYLTTGFFPSSFNSLSSLGCVLERNYSKEIPFLFPKYSRVTIDRKKFDIPAKYFARKKGYLDRENIVFIATTPHFSSIRQIFTKLPNRYKYHTNISISTIPSNEDLQNILSLYPGRNSQELEGEYRLKKRFFPKTEYLPESIKYYRVKNKTVDTVIDCLIDTTYKMNCQHRFIHNGLLYEFRHEQKDVKDWQNMQSRLINKVRSWESSNNRDFR